MRTKWLGCCGLLGLVMCLTLLSPDAVDGQQQPPGGFGPGGPGGDRGFGTGGPGGGKGGRGMPGFGPDQMFDMLAKTSGGTETINFDKIPADTKMMMRTMAERRGTTPLPETGTWNR